MASNHDKDVIEHWLRLYNRLTGSTFRVEDWPDRDSSKKNIDAICGDDDGHTLAIEHTLIEPFVGEKNDAARFMKTLATLENHPDLLEPGYTFLVSQPVDSIPTGINWGDVPKELLRQLPGILPTLPERGGKVVIRSANWSLDLQISKLRTRPSDPGRFLTARVYPGDPGPDVIISALKKKAPKLRDTAAEKKILLLEKDAAAGTIESQFEQLPDEPEIRALLAGIDEIWSLNTAGLESEGVIFTNRVTPPTDRNFTFCSLNVLTGEFWRASP